MVLRRILVGGAAALTLGSGLVGPALAQAADAPQTPLGAAQVGPIQVGPFQIGPVQADPAAQAAAAQPAAAQVAAAQPDAAQPGAAFVNPELPGEPRFAPSLTIHKAHEDPADHAVTYTLWVGNDGTAPTRGRYTVVDTLPDGVVATSVDGGRRWDCSADAGRTVVTCRSDADLAPNTSSDPIMLHTDLTDKDACYLVNVAGVTGGDYRGDMHLTKDSLKLPCHRDDDKPGINVNVNVTGNNNGGRGGDSSGATANGNGHVRGVTGGFANADADSRAFSRSEARARARSHAHVHFRRVTVIRHHRGCAHRPVHHRVVRHCFGKDR